MATKKIVIYIEGQGGGEKPKRRRYLDGEFRKSWKLFLKPLADHAKSKGVSHFQCIPGYGGDQAIDLFGHRRASAANHLHILLIDSEGPVQDVSKPWIALGKTPPAGVTDDHCYLIVQSLETWLCADLSGLQSYFDKPKKCFKPAGIPTQNLEQVDRKKLDKLLKAATVDCGRQQEYDHADGNIIIGQLDQAKLKTLSSVQRLFNDLTKVIEDYANS
ncbi:MAG: hypothetical protein WCG75_06770 [Armatimonadota bacterium]